MTLYWVAGQVVDDQQQSIPEGATRVPTFRNVAQYGSQEFSWDPSNRYFSGGIQQNSPGYLTTLLSRLDRQRRGEQLYPWEADEVAQWEATARAMPTRDIASLRAGWQGEVGGPQWWSLLDPGSPDAGPIMLQLRDKIMHGQATAQERDLYQKVGAMAGDWDYRASVPQESDANPFGMGDNLFGALMMLGMGATGGAAAGALAAGGLTLGSVGGLAGVAGGLTSMMGEALDEDVLRKMGISLGAVGGAAGLAALAQGGINTVGDLLKAVQKGYGVGSKAYGLATGAGSTPDGPRPMSSTAQAMSAADQRTQRSTGGGMAETTQTAVGGILDSLGPLLAGAVGAVTAGVSLADVQRYMDQLKTKYGQQEDTKRLIDQAYQLAVARYETFQARSDEEYRQKQWAYEDQVTKYQTNWQQTQLQQEQQQIQYLKESGQVDEDRARQLDTWHENRRNDLANFEERRAQAVEDRAEEKGVFRDQYGRHLTREDEIAAQVRRDRDTQYSAYEQQFGRHLTREDERAAQAREERGLDLNAYQQRQAVGRNLSDPATIAAGAQALYNPLSAAARDRINVQTEEEMARRGVAGGGQYSNLMAAKAFAPQEAQLWQNAMQNYLTGQQGAVNAYSQQDMTSVPGYTWAQRPEFSTMPRYNYLGQPEYATSPDYTPVNAPDFLRAGAAKVPGAVALPGNYPGAPTQDWNALRFDQPDIPGSKDYYPTPYKPWGTSAETGGGSTGALSNLPKLASNLTQLLGGDKGLVAQVMKLLGIGQGSSTDAWLKGGSWEDTSRLGDPSSLAARAAAGLLGGGTAYAGGSPYFDESGGMNYNFDTGGWNNYDFGSGFGGQMPAAWDQGTLDLYNDLGTLDLSNW